MFSSSRNLQEIVVIALQINNKEYWKLEPKEQIKLLSDRVHEIAGLLTKQKKDATWIITWQECGIRDNNSVSVSEEVKNLFKEEFKKISTIYPNLIVIAGTLLTKKSIEKDNLKKIAEYYKPLKWIEDIDKDYLMRPLYFEKRHLKRLQASESPLFAITNTARIYQNGEQKCHGKITPYYEERDDVTVFQPGKEQNLSPVISIDHLNIGIEICREHLLKYSVLKKHVNEFKVTPPQLHFILSDTIPLHLKPICAEHYVLHIDSKSETPPIITRGQKKNKMNLVFYRCDALQPIMKLLEPIAPIYPMQYRLLDLLEEVMSSASSENRMILEKIAENVIHLYGSYVLSDDEYVKLKKELEKVNQVSKEFYEKLLILLEKPEFLDRHCESSAFC